MTNSVYIHIPFCQSICSYCSFTKFFYNEKQVDLYLDSLKKEVQEKYKGEIIKTIYIGGGTPSSLNITEFKKLFEIIKIFKLSDNLEFTIEANPESIDEEKLKLFKINKVNRISMGVESTINRNLKYLKRNHDFKLVKEKINLIKKYITNINVDLIYGLKNQTLKDLAYDINNILSLDITHISTYSLMIEDNTYLKIIKEKNIPEDLDYEMYELIINKLKKSGFNHYEISNFSKPGYEAKHNLVYWNNLPYYGFGVSASGYLGNCRYTNTLSLKKYFAGNYLDNLEILSDKDIISYALILGFRKISGINKSEFFKRYKVNILDLYNIRDLIKSGLIIDNGTNLLISYDKIYVENSILINFVGE